MLRLFATVSVLALIISACTPEAADAPAPETPATSETEEAAAVKPAAVEAETPATEPRDFQLSYKLESDNYTVTSEIDPAILAFDAPIAWRLWNEAKPALDEFGAQADADRKSADEYAAETGEEPWFFGYSLDYTYRANAVFEDLISITQNVGAFSGGAHPNYFLGGGNYLKGAARPVALSDVVKDETAFGELVIAALVEEKLERGYEASAPSDIDASVREMLASTPELPDLYKGKWVLEASTVPGKIGGISVLFSPYDVGSYAEGSYVATLPASALAPILTDAWAPRFGGEPLAEEVDAEAP